MQQENSSTFKRCSLTPDHQGESEPNELRLSPQTDVMTTKSWKKPIIFRHAAFYNVNSINCSRLPLVVWRTFAL